MAYHVIYRLLYLTHRKFQDQINRLILPVLLLNSAHQRLRFIPISTIFYTGFASDLRVSLDHPKTNYLITIINQLVKKPFESVIRVFVGVKTAQEGARSFGVLVVFVLSR